MKPGVRASPRLFIRAAAFLSARRSNASWRFVFVVLPTLVSLAASFQFQVPCADGAQAVGAPQQPEILANPSSQWAFMGSNAVFTVVAQGVPVLKYQWKFNDEDIPGATASTLTLGSVQPSHAGLYRVVVTNQYGSAFSDDASLGVTTWDETLNCTNLVWALDAAGPMWAPQNAVTHDGVLGLRSGTFAYSYQVSGVNTTIEGPCTVQFWWKMEAPSTSPVTRFMIDGVTQLELTGNVDWQHRVIYVGSNAHTLAWKIYSNVALDPGSVAAWLDEVTILPGGQLPQIQSGPSDRTVSAGTMVVLRAIVEGHAPLRFQWQLGGKALPGATNAALVIYNAQSGDAGDYSVLVSNPYGSASAHAVLTVEDSAPVFLAQQPKVLTIAGGEAWLHARVKGSDPKHYQWRFEDAEIPGETSEVLKLRGVTTNQVGRYTVVVSNEFGIGVSAEIQLRVTQVRNLVHVSADGLSASYLAQEWRSSPTRFPSLQRFLDEGAGTLNARCDYFISYTVPNHVSMLTGRPSLQPVGQPNTVHHGYTYDDSLAGLTLHNSGNTNVPYKASVFDVAHDRGLSTAFLVSKSTLDICAVSYNAANGAPDLVGPDNGSNKIDLVRKSTSTALVDELIGNLVSTSPRQYTFIHLADPDLSGHVVGWGTPSWFDAVGTVDFMLGRIFSAITRNPSPAMAEQTVVLLTADHGGGAPSTTHVYPDQILNFTIPILAWGPGFPAGADLHSLFSNRADPGTNWLDYNAPRQPLRNGDTGNLALMCLGLPPIPGSSMIPLLESAAPRLTLQPEDDQIRISWSRAAVGFTLESSPALGPSAQWTPITTGIQTNADTFSYGAVRDAVPQFYRLTAVR